MASLVTEVLAPGEEEELRSDGLQTEASSESTVERRTQTHSHHEKSSSVDQSNLHGEFSLQNQMMSSFPNSSLWG